MATLHKQASKERLFEIIRAPIVTEKATLMAQYNQYVFRVADDATKIEIRQAVESLFKVNVLKVNTITLPGKKKVFKGRIGQRSGAKKAVVTLKQGQTIDLAAGI